MTNPIKKGNTLETLNALTSISHITKLAACLALQTLELSFISYEAIRTLLIAFSA